jgi:hypothetical protein
MSNPQFPPEPPYYGGIISNLCQNNTFTIHHFRKQTEQWTIAHFNDAIRLTLPPLSQGNFQTAEQRATFVAWCEQTRKERLDKLEFAKLDDRVTALGKRVSALENK